MTDRTATSAVRTTSFDRRDGRQRLNRGYRGQTNTRYTGGWVASGKLEKPRHRNRVSRQCRALTIARSPRSFPSSPRPYRNYAIYTCMYTHYNAHDIIAMLRARAFDCISPVFAAPTPSQGNPHGRRGRTVSRRAARARERACHCLGALPGLRSCTPI